MIVYNLQIEQDNILAQKHKQILGSKYLYEQKLFSWSMGAFSFYIVSPNIENQGGKKEEIKLKCKLNILSYINLFQT